VPLDGECVVAFVDVTDDEKTKNVFRFKKCFIPYRKDVKKIAGTFVNGNLEVYFSVIM
jgi:hypothetical protein